MAVLAGLLSNLTITTIALLAFPAICLFAATQNKRPKVDVPSLKLGLIPEVGAFAPLIRFILGAKFLVYGEEMIAEGYSKYKKMFFVPRWGGYDLVISDQKLIRELRDAPQDTFSFSAFASYSIEEQQLMPGIYLDATGRRSTVSMRGSGLVKGPWRAKIDSMVPILLEEIEYALPVFLGNDSNAWKEVPAFRTVCNILGTATTRLLVSAPLNRNMDFLNTIFANNDAIGKGSQILKKVAYFDWMKPYVARVLCNVRGPAKKASAIYDKLINERYAMMEKYGLDGWKEKPDDFLQWLLDTNFETHKWSNQDIAYEMLSMAFASLHTTTMTAAMALFELAARPEYFKPLRKEIKEAIELSGGVIDKAALDRMYGLDSFVKETQRMWPLIGRGLQRIALKEFTFSDGTHIPAGTHIMVASCAIQRDPQFYPDPHTFDGFRFAKLRKLREEQGIEPADGVTAELTATSTTLFLFGGGKNACPGRWFAAMEITLLLAMLLLEYDISFGPQGPPKKRAIECMTVPNMSASIRFRKLAKT